MLVLNITILDEPSSPQAYLYNNLWVTNVVSNIPIIRRGLI